VWLVVDDPVDDLGQEAGFGLKRGPLVGGLVVLFAPRFGPVPESLDWWPRVFGVFGAVVVVPLSFAVVVSVGPSFEAGASCEVRHGFTAWH